MNLGIDGKLALVTGAFVAELAASRGVDADTIEREFFASAQASATTGAALRVDGGVARAII
jgi:hypothetical protein